MSQSCINTNDLIRCKNVTTSEYLPDLVLVLALTRAFIKLTHKQPHLTSASWIYSKFNTFMLSLFVSPHDVRISENILDGTFAKHFSTNQILVIHRRVRKAVKALRFISTKYLKNMQRCTIKLLV